MVFDPVERGYLFTWPKAIICWRCPRLYQMCIYAEMSFIMLNWQLPSDEEDSARLFAIHDFAGTVIPSAMFATENGPCHRDASSKHVYHLYKLDVICHKGFQCYSYFPVLLVVLWCMLVVSRFFFQTLHAYSPRIIVWCRTEALCPTRCTPPPRTCIS